MPAFQFTARSPQGRTEAGVVNAANAAALAGELRQRGLLVLDVRPHDDAASKVPLSWNPLSWLPPTTFDVEIGMRQMASMLRSGLTLLAALKTTAEQARRPRMARIWHDLYERIEEGSNFSDAMTVHRAIFPEYIVQLARVGEQSGALETVLSRGADHLERQRNLKMTVVNALIYPAIVVLMAFGVAGFMLISVIPKIQKFLVGRGRALPGITQALLDISNWVTTYLPHIGVGMLAATIALFMIYRWPPGRLWIDGFLLRVPIVGGVSRLAGTAVFSRGLGLLLESGVTLLEGLRTVEHLMGNRAMGLRVGRSREAVLQGGNLAGTLEGGREFTPMLSRMVAVGETTGTLDPVLAEVATFHENQLAVTVRRLSVLIEPTIIIVVGGIVGFVYIAFFVALFSLAGAR
jgi:type IV pilus assembly protein PilC